MTVSVNFVPGQDPRDGRALAIAQTLLAGFDKHYRLFRASSAAAKTLFENGDWPALQRTVRERIQFYDERVAETVARLQREFGQDAQNSELWRQAKLYYIGLLTEHQQPELAETFFNSVCCKILHRTYFHNEFIFVRPAISTEYIESDPPPNEEAELSGEPWYSVGRNDVFPEEFAAFLLGDPRIRKVFMKHHAELLDVAFWQRAQEDIRSGRMRDFFPYPESLRFCHRYAATNGTP